MANLSIPLKKAKICLDCETLHTANICPRCASKAWTYIVYWLLPVVGAAITALRSGRKEVKKGYGS